MRYRHLFFDLDHTLWDFDLNSRRTWELLYAEYDLAQKITPDFNAFFAAYNVHNDRMWAMFRKGSIKRNELRWKRVLFTIQEFRVQDVNLAHELSSAYLEILPAQTALTPGAKDILDYCRSRYIMHLITNGFDLTQRQKLQFAGISNYFDQIITSEKSNSMKPNADIFDYALNASGAKDCTECLMIGDALDIDVLGAYNAGWDQVYYNPQRLPHTSKPTYEIAHWNDLQNIL